MPGCPSTPLSALERNSRSALGATECPGTQQGAGSAGAGRAGAGSAGGGNAGGGSAGGGTAGTQHRAQGRRTGLPAPSPCLPLPFSMGTFKVALGRSGWVRLSISTLLETWTRCSQTDLPGPTALLERSGPLRHSGHRSGGSIEPPVRAGAPRPVPPLCTSTRAGRAAEAQDPELPVLLPAPLFFGEEALTLFLLLREMHLEPNEGSKA